MSTIHQVKCDSCQKTEPIKFNGEHWLPPQGWVQVNDAQTTYVMAHLCSLCYATALYAPLSLSRAGRAVAKRLGTGK